MREEEGCGFRQECEGFGFQRCELSRNARKLESRRSRGHAKASARARAGRGLTTRDVVEAERPARWGAAFAVTEAEPAAQHTRYRAPPDVG